MLIEVVHPNRPPVAAVFLNSRLDASLRRRTTHVVFQAKDARPVSELSLEAQGVAKAYQMTKPRSSDVLLLGKVAAIPRASILSGMLRNLHVWNVLEAGAMYVLSGPTYYYNVECRARRGSSDDTDAPRLLHSGTLLRSGWDVLLKQGVQYDQRIPEASWFYDSSICSRSRSCTRQCARHQLPPSPGPFAAHFQAWLAPCTPAPTSGAAALSFRVPAGRRACVGTSRLT